MSIHQGSPQITPQNAYSPQPPPSRGTSVLAIVGFILAFCGGPLGFILSLVAIFQTGRDKKKGRGLAVAGVVISLVLMAGSTAAYIALSNSTVLDPGCTDGKAAILASDPTGGPAVPRSRVINSRRATSRDIRSNTWHPNRTTSSRVIRPSRDTRPGLRRPGTLPPGTARRRRRRSGPG